MYENPGDELTLGEVYRQVLQEAWLPEGAEEWMRLGKSRRGRRPTQRGLGTQSPSISQAAVRRCFQLCVQNWNQLPLEYPADHPCVGIPGKKWWWEQKEEKGLICSYYDHYMRYCMFYCLKISCPPEDIVCYAWDPDSTKETIHGYWAGIYVIGGFPPYEWQVNDPPFWLQAVITSIPKNGITTREDVCGIGKIIVTDYCGRTVEGVVTTPDVPWPYLPPTWPDDNPDEITPNTSKAIYIVDGVPPFTWEVAGTGFTLSSKVTGDRINQLIADPTACGTANISVTDCLYNFTLGSVRSTNGQWGTFFDCGEADTLRCSTIAGQYKHETLWDVSGPGVRTCPHPCADLGIEWGSCYGIYCSDDGRILNENEVAGRIRYRKWIWSC